MKLNINTFQVNIFLNKVLKFTLDFILFIIHPYMNLIN